MCWQCDQPRATWDDWLRHMRDLIDRSGWAVQYIERNGGHPPWAYTVGLTERDRPEIVITGMPRYRVGGFINAVAEHVRHAAAPAPGTQVRWVDGPLTEFVRVTVPDAHLHTAVAMYGQRNVRALQVVHADDRDHWPWDPYYRGIRGGQPVLGPREPAERRIRVG